MTYLNIRTASEDDSRPFPSAGKKNISANKNIHQLCIHKITDFRDLRRTLSQRTGKRHDKENNEQKPDKDFLIRQRYSNERLQTTISHNG